MFIRKAMPWLSAVAVSALVGCADRSVIITDCEAVGDKTPLCGWQRPEDMELLPDGKTLIVSQMEVGHGRIPGALALLDTHSGEKIDPVGQGCHAGNE